MSWQKKNKYQDLLAILQKEKRWAELSLLQGKESLDPSDLRYLFVQAVINKDDEGAVRIVRWMLQIIDDNHLLPLIDEAGQLPQNQEVKTQRDQADRDKASEVQFIWRNLPAMCESRVRVRVSEDDFTWRYQDKPTMLKTKEYVLTTVIKRWRETKDEDEADQLFQFLTELNLKFSEEKDLLVKLIREQGTCEGFPPARAARNYLDFVRRNNLSDYPGYGRFSNVGLLAKILTVCWMRNSSTKQRTHAILAASPVFDSSDEAVIAIVQVAERLVILDRAVTELKKELCPNSLLGSPALLVEYSVSDRPTVVVTVNYDRQPIDLCRYYSTSNRPQLDQNKAHDKFCELTEIVQKWRETPNSQPVMLRMVVASKFDSNEPLFQRERLIE